MQFSGTGHRLVAGLISGEICVYDSEKEKLAFIQKIECKNRTGKFAKGCKVTGIEFMGSNHPNCIMVTTNDSRIRFVNIRSGEIHKILMKLKAKGLRNEHSAICASLSSDYEHALCASEDNNVYIWSKIKMSIEESNKKGIQGIIKMAFASKLDQAECFQPNSN